MGGESCEVMQKWSCGARRCIRYWLSHLIGAGCFEQGDCVRTGSRSGVNVDCTGRSLARVSDESLWTD